MGSVERHVDVVVVGAGTAGANVAWQFASRGRRVLVLERRCVDAAGAQWVNGVLDWQFQRAGVDPPSGEERRRSGERIHLRAAADPTTVTLNDAPTVAADMTLLGRRLRQKAMEAGAEIIDQAPFQHEFGGLLGAYDALRRLTTRLGETGVAALMRAGVTGPSTLRAGLEQRWAAPPAGEVARSVQNLAREPSLAAQVLPALARARLLLSHGRSHPTDVDLVALDRWDRRTTTLLGALPS